MNPGKLLIAVDTLLGIVMLGAGFVLTLLAAGGINDNSGSKLDITISELGLLVSVLLMALGVAIAIVSL